MFLSLTMLYRTTSQLFFLMDEIEHRRNIEKFISTYYTWKRAFNHPYLQNLAYSQYRINSLGPGFNMLPLILNVHIPNSMNKDTVKTKQERNKFRSLSSMHFSLVS